MRLPVPSICALLLLCSAALQGQTLRWASQGDFLTLDPHSQNEGMTNMVNGQIYETLVKRDQSMRQVPALAVSWQQMDALRWQVRLRPGVRFHDGSLFSADDVLFSIARASEPSSAFMLSARALGTVVKLDALTLEFKLGKPSPIFLEQLGSVSIMSRAWCERYRVSKPLNFKNKEESHASLHANGTGPFMLQRRQPAVRSVFRRNPAWWGRFEGNLQEVVFTPIANDATRLAALVSGEIDLVLDPSPHDVERLRRQPGVQIIDGPENRLIYIGMDQHREQLLHGRSPDGRNPFKDQRVRQALYQAIDIEAIRLKVMKGLAVPTGGMTPSPRGAFDDPLLETRLPYDLPTARRLMREAGFAQGFEVMMDCPNNRYVNDEEICLALAAMWAKLGVRLKINSLPRSLFFPKIDRLDTSLYLLGFGGASVDAEWALSYLYHSRTAEGLGYENVGRWSNPRVDALAEQSSAEADPQRRERLVREALIELRAQLHVIPLHRQMIPWAAREGLRAAHRPDNWLELAWVQLPEPR